jgi:serine phosphatase RsbU (regulator of sigma subunit)
VTGLARHSIRAAALHSTQPAAILRDLNRILLLEGSGRAAETLEVPRFCTVCLVRLDLAGGEGIRATIACAGHPRPWLLHPDGSAEEITVTGPLLGILQDAESAEVTVTVPPGAALVALTDGILERREDGRFFEDSLPATLRAGAGLPAQELADHLLRSSTGFASTATADDMAVLVMRALPPA